LADRRWSFWNDFAPHKHPLWAIRQLALPLPVNNQGLGRREGEEREKDGEEGEESFYSRRKQCIMAHSYPFSLSNRFEQRHRLLAID